MECLSKFESHGRSIQIEIPHVTVDDLASEGQTMMRRFFRRRKSITSGITFAFDTIAVVSYDFNSGSPTPIIRKLVWTSLDYKASILGSAHRSSG
jgi:hypothetical protein